MSKFRFRDRSHDEKNFVLRTGLTAKKISFWGEFSKWATCYIYSCQGVMFISSLNKVYHILIPANKSIMDIFRALAKP